MGHTMTHSQEHWLFPPETLICPVCASALESPRCKSCNNEYFSFGGVPCVFPSGLGQKALWQHQMAMMQHQGSEALSQLSEKIKSFDNTPLTRKRLEISYAAMEEMLKSVFELFESTGINANFDEGFAQSDIDNPMEYYQHILRDWAWDENETPHFDTHANDANLKRVLDVWPSPDPGTLLVLGAGAGRVKGLDLVRVREGKIGSGIRGCGVI